jgi:hypothetical protein
MITIILVIILILLLTGRLGGIGPQVNDGGLINLLLIVVLVMVIVGFII